MPLIYIYIYINPIDYPCIQEEHIYIYIHLLYGETTHNKVLLSWELNVYSGDEMEVSYSTNLSNEWIKTKIFKMSLRFMIDLIKYEQVWICRLK